MTGDPECQPSNATPGPWTISEVRSVEGEYLIVGGEGHGFGLIASCPVKADAEAIVAAMNAVAATPSTREWALERAALDFIHKVDRGEARSKRSYAAFKAALELPGGPAQATRDVPFMAQEILDFLNSIEGAGYGGMASFEIVRGYAKDLALSSTNRGGGA